MAKRSLSNTYKQVADEEIDRGRERFPATTSTSNHANSPFAHRRNEIRRQRQRHRCEVGFGVLREAPRKGTRHVRGGAEYAAVKCSHVVSKVLLNGKFQHNDTRRPINDPDAQHIAKRRFPDDCGLRVTRRALQIRHVGAP